MHEIDPFDKNVEPDTDRHGHYQLGKNALDLADIFYRELSVLRHPAGSMHKNLPLNESELAKLTGLIENLTYAELTELIDLIIASQQPAYRRAVLRTLETFNDVKNLPSLDLE